MTDLELMHELHVEIIMKLHFNSILAIVKFALGKCKRILVESWACGWIRVYLVTAD